MLENLIVHPLNHLLGDAHWATTRLRHHAGAHVMIQSGPLQLLLGIDAQGMFQPASTSISPDVCIELPADLPVRLLVDRSNLMANARISGSADLAETLAFVFRNLVWDYEGDLARWVGDIPARRLSMGAQALGHAALSGGQRLTENLLEYVREENRVLVGQAELKDFLSGVDACRDQLARLEKRIQLLER